MADGSTRRGALFLVVGPSGAGKDSLIDRARAALAPDGSHLFARRVITRPAYTGGEVHEAVTVDAFERLRAAGAFALHWEAHGLLYGIRREIDAALVAGRAVVANVSRAIVDDARRRYAPVRILNVTAPAAVLAERIMRRGRETGIDVQSRLFRAGLPIAGDDVVTIANDGNLEQAAERFITALRQ